MSIRVKIVTPRAVAFDGMADDVRSPGYLGEFGVLPQHEHLLTLVQPGRVLLNTNDGLKGFIVGVGFAEVGPDRLTVLADHCEPMGAVEREQARRQLDEAEQALTRCAEGSAEWEESQRLSALARARLH